MKASAMPKTTFTSSPAVITVNESFSSKTTKRPPESMSPEDAQVHFERMTLALRKLNQHTYESTNISEPTILLCHSCDFKTTSSLRTHLEHHIKKFAQQCHLCSYSARKKEEIAYHLKNHHYEKPLISELLKDEQAAGKSSRYSSSQKKWLQCSQCGYGTSTSSSLKWHIYKKHQISTKPPSSSLKKTCISKPYADGEQSELVPNFDTDNKIRKSSNTKGFSPYQCELCDYETNGSRNLRRHRQFHLKKSAYQCDRCSYSVSVPQRLSCHMKKHHSKVDQAGSDSSFQDLLGDNTLLRHESKRVKRDQGNEESSANELEDLTSSFKCKQCSFFTNTAAKMTFHEKCHSSNFKRKCPLCSFSASLANVVTFHVKNHHGDDATFPPPKPKKVTRSVTSTDINLEPVKSSIKPRDFDAEEKSCREEMAQLEETLQSDRQSLEDSSFKLFEREKQMQSVRTRVAIAKENVLTTEKSLKDIQRLKNENLKLKKEALKKKMQTEFNLRTEQCQALESALIALDAVEEDHQENRVADEKRVKSLESQIGEIKKELVVLEEEGKTLSKDLEKAEACYLAAVRSLPIPQTELEALESCWRADAYSLNLMVDSFKERIKTYHQLEKQLLDIELGKKMDHLSQKKMSYLLSLKKLCEC